MEQLSELSPLAVAQSEQQFYDIVTKSYLPELCNYEIVPHRMTEDGKPSIENKKRFRWIKINEIVYNKDEFFVDKYSMLFVALHNIASQVAVYIRRESNATIHFYIGVRDINDKTNDQSKCTLINGLHGYFPGISTTDISTDDAPKEIDFETGIEQKDQVSIAAVSGIATLKDDEKGNFIQGIERLLNSVQEEMSVLIIADRVDALEVQKTKLAYETLYSNLSPLAERQLSCHNDYSKSISETISKNFSLATTKTIGKTITNGVNTSQSSQQGEGHNEHVGIGFILSTQENDSSNSSISSQIGHHRDVADVLSDAVQRTEGTSKAKGIQETTTTGNSVQVTFCNRKVKSLLDLLDKHIERTECSMPYGMWACSTYFIGTSETRTKAQANVYVGGIIGEQSNLETCVVNTWTDSKVVDYLRDISHPLFKYPESNILLTPASTVDSKELAIHVSLPQTSVPGIIVKERASFGRSVIKVDNEDASKENKFKLGNVCYLGKTSKIPVSLDVNTLCKHTFITGTTGSGKSNTIYFILQELLKKEKKILVIEPTKGEYKNIFGKGFWYTKKNADEIHVPIEVYGSNPRLTHLLRINPFVFPPSVHVYEHIDRLVEIFNVCWPMYAAMPVVLKKAITDAYVSCGWDLYKSECNLDNEITLYPTFDDVVSALRIYINNSEYSSDTKGDYKGSIETRLLSLTEGLTGEMLNKTLDKTLTDSDLFEKNVIIDLSSVGNTETKSLIMGLLVMKMTEYYQDKAHNSLDMMNSGLNHVTILEEAHNLLKRTSKEQSQEGSNIVGKSVEMITNSIAEMRTYGEGFMIIDQSPSMVDAAAIRNTNTKIIMSLPEIDDRTIIGKSISLSDKQIEEISRQKVGQAIVFQSNWEEPVQCLVSDFRESHNKDCRIKPEVFKNPEESNDICSKDYTKIIIKYLYNCCHKELQFDFEKDELKNAIVNSEYSSNLKYSLLKHVTAHLSSDKDELNCLDHVKSMELVAHCVGQVKNISSIISNKDNIDDINNTLMSCIQNEFPNESDEFYLFCVRCSFRLQASLSTSAIEKYNNWFNKYCK